MSETKKKAMMLAALPLILSGALGLPEGIHEPLPSGAAPLAILRLAGGEPRRCRSSVSR